MGLERMLTIFNGKTNVYDTELFIPLMEKLKVILEGEGKILTEKDRRIICEHTRTITFILGDPMKISPSNTEQGYILRRLIRRIIRLFKKADITNNYLCELSDVIIQQYKETYPELEENRAFILEQLQKEFTLFSKTLDDGLKKANRYLDNISVGGILSGELAFKLYDTYGFPIEFTSELALERGYHVDMDGFQKKFKEHQEKSRQGAAGKFAGGLADNNEQTARLHTATHLLNGALRAVLGNEVSQRGSNITSERLRFDFSFGRKVTREELTQVEAIVNEAIQKNIDVILEEMTPEKAYEEGAVGVFSGKYGEIVKVYTIPGYSKEICGGPHAHNTGELVSFKILKEQSSSAGVRRIKAAIGN